MSDAGLQAERTVLAWTRTSLGVLANGALLAVTSLQHGDGPIQSAAAGLAVAVALSIYLLRTQRERTLRRRPLPERVTARRQVHLVGAAVLTLVVVALLASELASW